MNILWSKMSCKSSFERGVLAKKKRENWRSRERLYKKEEEGEVPIYSSRKTSSQSSRNTFSQKNEKKITGQSETRETERDLISMGRRIHKEMTTLHKKRKGRVILTEK